ncbi:Hypothetical protein SCF082_LOCUS53342 [Durusdinium trenchii]|uniref:Uncharacterized protein n=1 Tax=Durusdinium trenchii TaxID=1381693 RepID=A0ABP0SSV9_9DINO|eukprot:g6249.t1
MYMFHRLLSLVTMMYNEQDQLTLCDFVRPAQRRQLQRDRDAAKRREAEPDSPGKEASPKAEAKAKPAASAI